MKKFLLSLVLLSTIDSLNAQCFTNDAGVRLQPVNSFYANKGTGKYKNEILWLDWSHVASQAGNVNKKTLKVNDYANAEIKISNDKYICIQTKVVTVDPTIANRVVATKIDQPWSRMDESYSVPGHGKFQILETPNGKESNIKFESNAFIRSRNTSTEAFKDTPFRIKGVILADSESAASMEYMSLTADGTWNIFELLRDFTTYPVYKIKKENLTTTESKLTLGYGEDTVIGLLALLSFKETAYSVDKKKVTYSVKMKGNGITSIAIGLLTPYADFGDTPESYGSPIHLVDKINFDSDNYQTIGKEYNLKDDRLVPGKINTPEVNYIGSTGPSPNSRPTFSIDALGDDFKYDFNETTGEFYRIGVRTKEEDGWPVDNSNFSYVKQDGANLVLKKQLKAKVPIKIDRKSILAGWIDFNGNGKFDNEGCVSEMNTSSTCERVFKVITPNNFSMNNSNPIAEEHEVNLEWDIPQNPISSNLKTKDTYVRLRLFNYTELFPSNSDATEIIKISPTSDTYGGEVEDHKIDIIKLAVTNPMLFNPAVTN